MEIQYARTYSVSTIGLEDLPPHMITRKSSLTCNRQFNSHEDSSEISDDLESHENSERIASPSPPTRSRSSSPEKTVTFLQQDE